MLKVYIDASTKGNPGPSGGGILIVYQGKQEQLSIPLSVGTNHQAEFEVFLKTLEFLKNKDLQWLPENKNKGADNLARQALQKQLKER